MKTSTSLLLALGSLALLVGGCAAPTDDSSGEADQAAVSNAPNRKANNLPRATLELSGKRLFSYLFQYDEGLTVTSNVPGLPAGGVLVDQQIDVTNRGDSHVFGVYSSEGVKLSTIELPAGGSASFQIRKVGQYALTCEDCMALTDVADGLQGTGANDSEEFVQFSDAGKASDRVRPTVAIQAFLRFD